MRFGGYMTQDELVKFLVKLKNGEDSEYLNLKRDISEYLFKQSDMADNDELYANANKVADDIFAMLEKEKTEE